jgi:hypothetical protein
MMAITKKVCYSQSPRGRGTSCMQVHREIAQSQSEAGGGRRKSRKKPFAYSKEKSRQGQGEQV